MCVLLQRSIHYRKAAANSYVAMVGATPYSLFLKVPWVYMRLASSSVWGHFNTLCHQENMKKVSATATICETTKLTFLRGPHL